MLLFGPGLSAGGEAGGTAGDNFAVLFLQQQPVLGRAVSAQGDGFQLEVAELDRAGKVDGQRDRLADAFRVLQGAVEQDGCGHAAEWPDHVLKTVVDVALEQVGASRGQRNGTVKGMVVRGCFGHLRDSVTAGTIEYDGHNRPLLNAQTSKLDAVNPLLSTGEKRGGR